MTERKPPGVGWESWVEGQIREGIDRGELDDVPGAEKPLRDIDQPHDEMWWLKEKLRRENVSLLPPALAVRRELEDALDRIAKADTESAVRQIVAAINERIVQVNSRRTSGPPTSVMPLNVDRVVQDWRNRRAGVGHHGAASVSARRPAISRTTAAISPRAEAARGVQAVAARSRRFDKRRDTRVMWETSPRIAFTSHAGRRSRAATPTLDATAST